MDVIPVVSERQRWYRRPWVLGAGISLALMLVGWVVPLPFSIIAAAPAFLIAKYFEVSWLVTGIIIPLPTLPAMVISAAVWAGIAEFFALAYRHRARGVVRASVALACVVLVLFIARGAITTGLSPYAPSLCALSGSSQGACYTRAAHARDDASFCHLAAWDYTDEGYLPCLEPFLSADTPAAFCDGIPAHRSGTFNACIERLAELHRDPSLCFLRTVDREQCAARVNPAPYDGGDGGIACTADAMQCPDGTWVGRTGPKCEFVCP